MRRSIIALAICLSAVGAAQSRRFDDRQGLVGRYTTDQYGGRIHRVLILDRDGSFQLNTTSETRDRWDMSRDDVKRYGTTAERAWNTHRLVKHVGDWEMNGGRLKLRMIDVIGDLKGSEKFDVDLNWRDGAFVFDKNTEVYGTESMRFRRDSPWPDNRPGRPGYGDDDRPGSRSIGSANYNGKRLRIDGATLRGSDNDSSLTVRLDGQRLEFRGKLIGRGDRITFLVDRRGGTSGSFKLELRNNEVRAISGSGYYDYKVVLLSD